MAGSIVIPNNQVRVKDSYASAPIINLTLRANGEEKVMVMDSLGQFVEAGLAEPTVAPVTAVVVAPAPGMTNPKWVYYRYVYAATKRYPLVENAITAGGNVSPRSNPSPSASANIAVANRGVDVTVTKSTRLDIDAIWIYRTDYYDTQAEALQASDEGLLYYVDSVFNDGAAGTVVYQDRTTTVTGNELLELDNFPAEQFALCVYVDPYFYGYANREFTAEVTVDATGLVTLNDPWSAANLDGDKWFDGRNRQVVTMEGITTGGFDGYGSYYFKWIDNSTAQLCLDLQLLQNGPVDYTGTTVIKIKGPLTNLYRSKPRNPFSWGTVVVVGDIAVPQPYVHRVGGGQGTAICVVPVLNLLKVDTEGPDKTYVFNLKMQGTEDFEASQQEISSDYSASNHWAQFPAKTAQGASLIWFIDNKHQVVCESDGMNNREISSRIFDSIRNLSTDPDDRLLSHGVYDPSHQFSLIWVTSEGASGFPNHTVNDKLLLFHHPTDTWSVLDQRGVLCSTAYLDRGTSKRMVLVGTETGMIGQMFVENIFWNWIRFPQIWPKRGIKIGLNQVEIDGDIRPGGPAEIELEGLWMTFAGSKTIEPYGHNNNIPAGWARIESYLYDAPSNTTTVTFDRFIRYPDGQCTTADGFDFWYVDGGENPFTFVCFLEAIVCNSCKHLVFENFTAPKTVTEVWVAKLESSNTSAHNVASWTTNTHGRIVAEYPPSDITYQQSSSFDFKNETINSIAGSHLYKTRPINIDILKRITLELYDIGYTKSGICGYQLAFQQGET